MSAAILARCPNPDIYLHKVLETDGYSSGITGPNAQATRKHLDRNTGRNQSVICSSEHKDPRLYTYGVLPMQDLDVSGSSIEI